MSGTSLGLGLNFKNVGQTAIVNGVPLVPPESFLSAGGRRVIFVGPGGHFHSADTDTCYSLPGAGGLQAMPFVGIQISNDPYLVFAGANAGSNTSNAVWMARIDSSSKPANSTLLAGQNLNQAATGSAPDLIGDVGGIYTYGLLNTYLVFAPLIGSQSQWTVVQVSSTWQATGVGAPIEVNATPFTGPAGLTESSTIAFLTLSIPVATTPPQTPPTTPPATQTTVLAAFAGNEGQVMLSCSALDETTSTLAAWSTPFEIPGAKHFSPGTIPSLVANDTILMLAYLDQENGISILYAELPPGVTWTPATLTWNVIETNYQANSSPVISDLDRPHESGWLFNLTMAVIASDDNVQVTAGFD